MPRFIARPIVVEAHQLSSFDVPPGFAFAVKRWLRDGVAEVATGDGPRPCRFGDWIVRGPDGGFSVIRDATFEMLFDEQLSPDIPFAPEPERVKRAYNRRSI